MMEQAPQVLMEQVPREKVLQVLSEQEPQVLRDQGLQILREHAQFELWIRIDKYGQALKQCFHPKFIVELTYQINLK